MLVVWLINLLIFFLIISSVFLVCCLHFIFILLYLEIYAFHFLIEKALTFSIDSLFKYTPFTF